MLEREVELRAVDDLLAAGRAANGQLLLVEGHAGIGKSALLDAAVARARGAGMTVMRARASELESEFAFGIALQLFEPLLAGADDETRDRLLAGSAALAGPLLERPTSWGGDEAEDRSYPVLHGLFWLLSNLAETGPVLIVIDDAHWADRASLRLVLYLLQRLDEMAVSILVARRLGEPGAPDDLLGQIAAHRSSRRVRPPPLSREGARLMVSAALPDADEAFADACWRMTEGNVFLLGELVRAVEAEGWKPTAQNAAQIGTLAPEAVLRAVAVRLMRLSDEAAAVARGVAVLGDDAQLRHVAALIDGTPDRVAAAADALAASEILRPLDAGALRFAHPLLASAVYADLGTGERAALHRRAAEILFGEDIAPERVAAHLLPSAGTGASWVVEMLAAAAARALELGAPESAATYLRRALDEPPDAAARAGLLRQLGVSEAATGLPSAVGRLEEALAAAPDERDRARTLLALGCMLAAIGRHDEALRAFDEAAESGEAEPHVAEQARAEAGALGAFDAGRRAVVLQAAGEQASRAPEPASAAQRAQLATLCLHQAMRGAPREEVVELARRALADGAPPAVDVVDGSVIFGICLALHSADELDWSDRLLTAAISRSRARGSMLELATASLCRAASRWGQGRLAEALADAEAALDAERYGWRHFLPSAYGVVVGLLLERGELDAAAACAARHDAAGAPASAIRAPWHEALGRLALVERREADALTHFEAWRDAVAGIVNPACLGAWRSASVYALTRLGRAGEARALAAEELALARAYGAPGAISVALRALAHAEAHRDLERPIELLEEAVAVVGGSQARLVHCRALLDFGAVLRRAGRRSDAGRALGEALALARASGARLVEERALEELEVAGALVQRAARRGADALSPSERRVVDLAIDGLSNREIAEALFVTRKAVEWHLGNAYRKLDVRSRRELPAALGAPDGAR
ncbi:MAG TPA: AAA family ATPase [Solirubrobacteraceae bacterium]|nr:AAA family ATPase [Solirubrobacteraceae bacterium]